VKKRLTILILSCVFIIKIHAQLGFCNGNSGDPIFTEDFGVGLSNSPLPAGTTTYIYSGVFPDDGEYTVSNGSFGNSFDWHQIQDHTPGDANGKCMIVNAGFSAGEFYRTIVSGLCETTTYEFSAWLINLVIAGSFCSTQPSGTIPINVSFEIWDSTDANLLAIGITGNVFETSSPNWQEYALVFQTLPGQTAVILKIINNSIGGCGNDLAIDDIEFKTCGDTITVTDILNNNAVSLCSGETPFATTLTATPDNAVFSNHFYQWQESADGVIWTDIVGATTQNLIISGITTTIYYRSKVAEFAANLTNADCITFSDIYEVIISQAPSPPTTDCWETATLNNTTCLWEVTGTQPAAPTGLDCWETAAFNTTTCLWEVTGTQPMAPTGLDCWETSAFNSMTCLWEVIGTQPAAPTGLECWEIAVFNTATCLWEVTGTQPPPPTGLECWETAIFNNTTCIWDVDGEEPIDTIEEFVVLCEDGTVTLSANSNLVNPSFLWSTGEITEEIIVTTPGTYAVEITDNTCITIIKTIDVSLIESPQIESVFSEGSDIIIEMLNTGDFEYSLDGVQYQTSNVFSNAEGGFYTVYVRELNGCGIDTTNHLHFKIPKFFTPNSDGIHDTFSLNGIEYFSSSEVYIYDRYGKLLKSTKNQPFNWDGTFNNQDLPSSDYWYVIKIDDQFFRGHFTLKR